MDSLVSMRVFCLVAELKSLAAAAERLRISAGDGEQAVMQLEKRLGTPIASTGPSPARVQPERETARCISSRRARC